MERFIMRKIFIVVERRSDYSRYKPILEKLQSDPFFKVYLVATGLTLIERHGHGVDFIKEDGIKVDKEIPMYDDVDLDSPAEMVRGMSRFMMRIVDELERVKPDLVLAGFDIGAQLSLTIAAAYLNIPIVHLQGGELSGSIDESVRHAISKFSHFHLVATDQCKDRLVRMGERPDRVFVVGCPSVDTLSHSKVIRKEEIAKEFDIDFNRPMAILIQHPVTTENKKSYFQIKTTIEAVKSLNLQTIIIMPNNDAGYSKIIKGIRSSKIKAYPNLSGEKYSNLLRYSSILIGNSSSGIHEAATFKVPVVNIGNRQQGREKAENVIDVPHNKEMIVEAIKKALYNKPFRNKLQKVENPYGDGNSTEKIIKVLKEVELEGVVQKKFYE